MRLFSVLSAAALGCALFVGGASAQEVQERTIRWGHLNNTDHPVSFGVQKFAEILLAKSGGKMKVREFAASQLGNELQQQSALRGGTQEMLSASTTSLATVIPEFGLLDFPFIAATTDQADALVQGAFGKAMIDGLPSRGLIGLGYWGLGFRNVTNSRLPDHQARGFRRPQAARDSEPGLSGILQRLQGQPDSDGVRRTLFGAGNPHRRWPGKSLHRHPVQQVLRSAEIRLGHQPHLYAEHHPGQQDLLGQAVADRAAADAGGLQRKPRLSEGADAAADRKGAGRTAEPRA